MWERGDCRVWGKSTVRLCSCSAGYDTWCRGKKAECQRATAGGGREGEEEEEEQERETGGGEGRGRPHWSSPSLKGGWNLTSNKITSPLLPLPRHTLHSAKQCRWPWWRRDSSLFCHFEMMNLTHNTKRRWNVKEMRPRWFPSDCSWLLVHHHCFVSLASQF